MAKLSVIAPLIPGGDFPVVDAEHVGVNGGNLKDFVDNAEMDLDSKADKSEVEAAFAAANVELGKKTNKTDVNTELAKKENTSDVDAKLAGKVSNSEFNAFKNRTDNPHSVTKAQVGLENVNNTSDLDKPISTATQIELNKKAAKSEVEAAFAAANVELAKKANKSDVDASFDQVNTDLSKKANKTDVAAELVTKANKIDVETALSNKADTTYVDVELSKKADITVIDKVYDTVDDMKSDESLTTGTNVRTNGYYSFNDGGTAHYLITDSSDGKSYHEVLDNGLYARLIVGASANVLAFGAKINSNEINITTSAIQSAINHYSVIEIPTGKYNVSKITVPDDKIVRGNNATLYSEEDTGYIITVSDKSNIYDLRLEGRYNTENTLGGVNITKHTTGGNLIALSPVLNNVAINHLGGNGVYCRGTQAFLDHVNVAFVNGYGYDVLGTDNVLSECFAICCGKDVCRVGQHSIITGGTYYWPQVINGAVDAPADTENRYANINLKNIYNVSVDAKVQDSFYRMLKIEGGGGHHITGCYSSCGESIHDGTDNIPFLLSNTSGNKINVTYGNGFVGSGISHLLSIDGLCFDNDITIQTSEGNGTALIGKLYDSVKELNCSPSNKLIINNVDYSTPKLEVERIGDTTGSEIKLGKNFSNIWGFDVIPRGNTFQGKSLWVGFTIDRVTGVKSTYNWFKVELTYSDGTKQEANVVYNKYANHIEAFWVGIDDKKYVQKVTILNANQISGRLVDFYWNYSKT